MDGPILQHTNQSVSVAPALAANNGQYHARQIQRVLPPGIPTSAPFAGVIPYEQIKAIDFLSDGTEHTLDEQMSAWLTLGANHLSMLLDAGWSSEQVLDSLLVVLQGLQGLTKINRRKLLELGTAALVSKIPLSSSGQIIESERLRITEALGKSIGDGWKLFHKTNTDSLFAIAESQLFMMQQVHTLLFPSIRCMFYSSIYRLKGAALFFLARYAEAMKAFEQAYIAGLESNDPWNMAESLCWQGGVWKACSMQDKAIQTTEAALRLTCVHEERSLPLRARLLAHWAESAALLHQSNIMMEKLEAAANLLKCLETNDEFDYPTWQQYQAICHYYNGDIAVADRYFQQTLEVMKPGWILQKGYTLLLQAQTRLKMGEIDRSIATAHDALPFITTINSPLINRGLMDYALELMRFSDNVNFQSFAKETQQLALHAGSVIPRYLEAKI